ncbi:MAG: hypothetical protein ABW019_14205 [Chitinophagaceae bacterium]
MATITTITVVQVPDHNHITPETVETRLNFFVTPGNKIKSFIDYLHTTKYKGNPVKKD